MNLTDKQINDIMELADNYAVGCSFVSADSKAKARFKLEKNLMLISIQVDNQEHKAVYEYQWVAITNEDGMFITTDFYKTKKAARKVYCQTVKYLFRLKQTKREVKG